MECTPGSSIDFTQILGLEIMSQSFQERKKYDRRNLILYTGKLIVDFLA